MRNIFKAIGGLLVLGACIAASPAYAQETDSCTGSLAGMAKMLGQNFQESPLVGLAIGDPGMPTYMITIWVNPDTNTWTVTQSNSNATCIVKSILEGDGGVVYDVQGLYTSTPIGSES